MLPDHRGTAPPPASMPASNARCPVTDFGADGAVVYDPASGDTHLLDPLEAELMPMLAARPEATAVSLIAEFVDAGDASPGDDVAAVDRIDRAIERLRGLGLVLGAAT